MRVHSPKWLYPLTAPLAILYGAIVSIRNRFYDNGIFSSYAAAVPVISIGGLTAGGSSKTPLSIWTLAQLEKLGAKPGLLSRGYGRKSKSPVWVSRGDGSELLSVELSGDEPRMIAERFPNIPVYCDANRVRGAHALVDAGCDVIVLDDGFQHRRIKRNVDWVILDATLPRLAYRYLPLGFLREGFSSISRAQALWLRVDKTATGTKWQTAIKNMGVTIPVVAFRTRPSEWRLQERTLPLDAMKNKTVFAFAGIAHPERFRASITALGVKVVGTQFYRDHHFYTHNDLTALEAQFRSSSAEYLVTTEKDYVKLPAVFRLLPVAVLRVDVEPMGEIAPLLSQLREILPKSSPL
ncbi:MAG: tetraacyldisaccharide 4'-kinase [bacterium]|nr:tetraacyldisaccharide 4'-kinase [bacterium]